MEPMPERIRLRRSKGWRLPPGAIVVARPTRWGNPFTMKDATKAGLPTSVAEARRLAVAAFASWFTDGPSSPQWSEDDRGRWEWMHDHLDELAGHDLACWCPLDEPCHAEVLLEWANREPAPS